MPFTLLTKTYHMLFKNSGSFSEISNRKYYCRRDCFSAGFMFGIHEQLYRLHTGSPTEIGIQIARCFLGINVHVYLPL